MAPAPAPALVIDAWFLFASLLTSPALRPSSVALIPSIRDKEDSKVGDGEAYTNLFLATCVAG